MNLWDYTLAAFASDALSESFNVDPLDFQDRDFQIQAHDTATGMFFNIFSFDGLETFVRVPEPSGLALAGCGLLLLSLAGAAQRAGCPADGAIAVVSSTPR